MGNIVLLDDLTINKIAAGEVIERPASVVKEMVENSIDAGAKNILIEIKKGGISLIKITDDGCGLSEDDMEIAFERHATSKIRSAEDLTTVKSMGFRGEALASIVAIAKVEMISKTQKEKNAHKIVIEGGKTVEFTEAARSVGTTITVENLFYNTPVRYKFLKKDYTEAGYIEDVVTRIALVNKNISIKLISNGKTVVQTNGSNDLNTVIYSIYGKDVATEVNLVEYEYEEIKVVGAVGKPVIARGNRSNQLFFLNGRYIKDKNLTAAADQAFKGLIPVGRYGFLVLNILMEPKYVDVNVHPAKLEVRFEDETKVFKAVYHAIRSSLAKSELVENVQTSGSNQNNENNSNLVIEESATQYDKNTNKSDQEDTKKKGIVGLFSKIIKEKDETEEELSNNHLEEIFKYRQSMANSLSASNIENNISKPEIKVASQPIEDDFSKINPQSNKEKIQKILDEYHKKMQKQDNSSNNYIGDTLISSDTIAINTNNSINATTTEVDFKKILEKQDTHIIDIDSNQESETKTININENKNVIQDTFVADSNLNFLPQNTINLNSKVKNNSEVKKDDVFKKIELPKEEEKSFANIENNSQEVNNQNFLVLAENLVRAKIGFDNTQMIDTNKVREALKEENFESTPEFAEMYKKTFGEDPFSVRKEKELRNQEKNKINASNDFSYANSNMNVFEEKEEYSEVPYKFIGIAFNTYIIIELKDEIYIIDQHAAHERILYERVRQNYYNEEVKDEQFLLMPDVISLTHKEMIIAKENVNMFASAGFSFEDFGENTIKLMSVPSMCEQLNTKQLFLDILDEIDTVAVTAKQEKEDKFIATVACKAAVKAKMKLDEKEVKSLMKKLLELPNPFTCPHGRPTAIKMTKNDLDKKFSRR